MLDRLRAGKVVKDFGDLGVKPYYTGMGSSSALLVERRGELRFVLKAYAVSRFGLRFGLRYFPFRLTNALRLREFIDESEQIARGPTPIDNVKEGSKPFLGPFVKDFGRVEQEVLPLGSVNISALLVERDGEPQFVLRFSYLAFSGLSVVHLYFGLEDAYRLREHITESERIAAGHPRSSYDPRIEAVLVAVLLALATIATARFTTGCFNVVAFVAVLVIGVYEIRIFRRLGDRGTPASLLMALLTLGVLIFAGLWLTGAIGF